MSEASFYMQIALDFAALSIGVSRPNPAVGAVVVKDGVIVGKGRTQVPGNAHAEVMALREAGEKADGADLYVTLEPCCHFGRTPPCTSAIINAKIKRVFYAHQDPNPVVRGNSRKILENAGIEVFETLEACGGNNKEGKNVFDAVERYFEAYDYFVSTKRTFVELKSAVTADFKMANADKSPLKITGEAADVWNHGLRSISDAILVGASTVLQDNPSLNVRLCNGNSPVRVVIANNTILPGNRKVFSFLENVAEPLKNAPQIIVFSACDQPELRVFVGHVEVIKLVGKTFEENWTQIIDELSKRGMHRLMVEPGAELTTKILQSGMWQRLDLWISDNEASEGLEYPKNLLPDSVTESFVVGDLLKVYKNY